MWSVALLFVICSTYSSADLTLHTFNQTLDHFNPTDTRTFPQRYWIVDDYWNRTAKAPVLLFLGLAAPFYPPMTSYGIFAPALKDYNALGVGIENRYYGPSLAADMLKLENLKYLTFEQSIEDTKSIQDEIKNNYNISDLNWITFGASYSGMKSVIHRLKAPNRFFAAFASSAPVNFQYDMPDYLGHVGQVVKNNQTGGSLDCFNRVREAFAKVDHLLDNNDIDALSNDFNFCHKTGTNNFDNKEKFAVAIYLSGLFADFDQFSFTNVYTNPYVSICRPFTRKDVDNNFVDDAYDVLKRIQWESNPNGPKGCKDVSYQALLDSLTKWSNGISDWNEYNKDNGGRAWGFEICNNMGFNVYCSVAKGCPLSNYASQLGQTSMCLDAFNITDEQMRSNSAKFLQTYGGANPSTTRLLLTNGGIDCGYPYGITTSKEDKEIYSLTIPITGHVADISPSTPYEPLVLYQTRQAVAQILNIWVKQATITGTTTPVTGTTTSTATTNAPCVSTTPKAAAHIYLSPFALLCVLLLLYSAS